MKKVNFNALDLDPETISNLTDAQAEEVEGGGSCGVRSCNNAARSEDAELPTE